MKSAEIKDISIKDLQERIETEKAQLGKLKVQHAVTITHSLVVMEPGKPAPVGNSSKVIASLLPTGHLIRHQIWGNCMASTEIRIWTRRKANSGKARLKA